MIKKLVFYIIKANELTVFKVVNPPKNLVQNKHYIIQLANLEFDAIYLGPL